jgi:CRISPR-associated protein Csx17
LKPCCAPLTPALREKQPIDAMPTITLNGCAPVPLAHYLKALGILRLVSEQVDANATVHWIGNQFIFASQFETEPLLCEFFLQNYTPTPIAVPWSGGDFFAVDRKKQAKSFDKTPTSSNIIEAIMSVSAKRFEKYQGTLHATFSAMDRAGVTKKKDIEGSGGIQRRMKAEMLKSLRNSLPDEALVWIDAAAVVEPDAVAFNALLGGGGGSDGNSHFSDNFMQCLWMVLPEFDVQRKKPLKAVGENAVFNTLAALKESLFGTQGVGTKIPGLSPVLFDSTRVGGANQTCGFEAKASSNPWDFILMLEGAVLFAGAIGRKLDDKREPSARFPFLLQASPVGLGSSYLGESSGRELWLPLWSQPARLAEIQALLAEGRVEKHGRMAKRGTDAFVATAQLGFDRGISSFQRTGFFKGRIGGDNYFTAIDQGRITPRRNPAVDLLRDVDEWLTRLNSATSNDKCPASVASATVVLERRITDLAVSAQSNSSHQLLTVLAALGSAERALAKSYKWAENAYLRPLHGLREYWLIDADNNSPEFRLAQSIAGTRSWLGSETLWFRQHLEPLKIAATNERSWVGWDGVPSNDVVWHDGDLTGALNAILARRIMRVAQSGAKGWPDTSPRFARLDDITCFIEGRTNDALLADLIWGLSLLDWQQVKQSPPEFREIPEAIPSSFYALLRLCFRPASGKDDAIPLVPAILNRAMNGDGKAASELAARRLRASGKAPLVDELPVAGDIARRTAAAMLFPISPQDFGLLEHNILKPHNT